jgi:hypothetical protein
VPVTAGYELVSKEVGVCYHARMPQLTGYQEFETRHSILLSVKVYTAFCCATDRIYTRPGPVQCSTYLRCPSLSNLHLGMSLPNTEVELQTKQLLSLSHRPITNN